MMPKNRQIRLRLMINTDSGADASTIASRLQQLGFTISASSERGVDFFGPSSLVEQVFAINLDDPISQALSVPEVLAAETEAVYIPTSPIIF